MHEVFQRIVDKEILGLIRQYLKSGVMTGGIVSLTDEVSPQRRSAESVIIQYHTERLDKELETRGHRFC